MYLHSMQWDGQKRPKQGSYTKMKNTNHEKHNSKKRKVGYTPMDENSKQVCTPNTHFYKILSLSMDGIFAYIHKNYKEQRLKIKRFYAQKECRCTVETISTKEKDGAAHRCSQEKTKMGERLHAHKKAQNTYPPFISVDISLVTSHHGTVSD